MKVSQNEVYRIAQRALEGAGAAYGIDRDGAHAVAWLDGRGLPGLAMLAAALDRMDGAFEPLPPPSREGANGVLDLAGRPAVAWAGAVMDCLTLLLAEDANAGLALRQARWPLFLLPLAVQRVAGGHIVRLRWQAGGAMLTCIANPVAGCRIVAEGEAVSGEGGLAPFFASALPADVTLDAPARVTRGTIRTEPAAVIDAAALEMALQRSLAEGIAVDDAVWSRVTAAANRVLVPDSPESRARGAGGGDANE